MILVVSPHLDDAVLSVGQVIDACDDVVVATVFAGAPQSPTILTAYDKSCGFSTSQGSMLHRSLEDGRAMLVLGAESRKGEWLDGQYGVEPDRQRMQDWLYEMSYEAEHVLVPLGVKHPDHMIAASEARDATRAHDSVWVYEELPYRVQFPENVAASITTMRNDGWQLELGDPFGRGSLDRKVAAMHCYRSQVSPEMVRWSQVPERLWRLTHD